MYLYFKWSVNHLGWIVLQPLEGSTSLPDVFDDSQNGLRCCLFVQKVVMEQHNEQQLKRCSEKLKEPKGKTSSVSEKG